MGHSFKVYIVPRFRFQTHIDKALEILPPEASLYHLRARWCYSVADLSWLERKVAATLFAEPPKSSYEEALASFLEVSEIKFDLSVSIAG